VPKPQRTPEPGSAGALLRVVEQLKAGPSGGKLARSTEALNRDNEQGWARSGTGAPLKGSAR